MCACVLASHVAVTLCEKRYTVAVGLTHASPKQSNRLSYDLRGRDHIASTWSFHFIESVGGFGHCFHQKRAIGNVNFIVNRSTHKASVQMVLGSIPFFLGVSLLS